MKTKNNIRKSDINNIKSKNHIKTIKLLLLGDKNTGKTALVEKICKHTFNYSNHIPTFGVNYNTLYLNKYQHTFNIDFWDLSGCKDYLTMLKIYSMESDYLLLCFDLSQPKTLESLFHFWLQELNKINFTKPKHFILIGTKNDLNQTIQEETIKQYTVKHKLTIFRLSAKKTESFDFLINYIINTYCNQYRIPKYIENKKPTLFKRLLGIF